MLNIIDLRNICWETALPSNPTSPQQGWRGYAQLGVQVSAGKPATNLVLYFGFVRQCAAGFEPPDRSITRNAKCRRVHTTTFLLEVRTYTGVGKVCFSADCSVQLRMLLCIHELFCSWNR